MKTLVKKSSGKSLTIKANSNGQKIAVVFTKVSRKEIADSQIKVYKPLVP